MPNPLTKFSMLFIIVLAACSKQDQQTASLPIDNGQTAKTLADCERIPDPTPADNSATGRAVAVTQGQTARAACKKEVAMQYDSSNDDIKRIREIMESEQAAKTARVVSDKEYRENVRRAGAAPLKEYKY